VARLQRDWPQLHVAHDDGPHPHEAAELALDCGKATRELGWTPVWDADTTLQRTARWYRDFNGNGQLRSHDDLATYIGDARRAGLGWAT